MKAKLIPIILLVVIAVGLTSLQLSGNLLKPNNVIRIGYMPLSMSLPLFVATENGYFHPEGLEYELIHMESTDEIVQALLSNKIDVAFEADFAPVLGLEAMNPGLIKVFSVSDLTTDRPFHSIIARQESKISQLKDLEGKKVAISGYGRMLNILFANFLISKEIDPEKVLLVEVSPDAQLKALKDGMVDAAVAIEPTITQAMNSIGAKRIYGSFITEQLNHNPEGAAFMTSEFIRDNPDLAKKITKIFDRSVDYIRSDEARARGILAKTLDINQKTADTMTLFYMVKSSEVSRLKIQEYIDMLFNIDQINKKLVADNLIYIPD